MASPEIAFLGLYSEQGVNSVLSKGMIHSCLASVVEPRNSSGSSKTESGAPLRIATAASTDHDRLQGAGSSQGEEVFDERRRDLEETRVRE